MNCCFCCYVDGSHIYPALYESLDHTEQDDAADLPDNNSDSTEIADDGTQVTDDADDNDDIEPKPPLR